MASVLYIAGPYPGRQGSDDDKIREVAEYYVSVAVDAGWSPLCPSLWPGPDAWCVGREMIDRLDAITDAVLMLPDWLTDGRAIDERQRASVWGLEIFSVRDGAAIPFPSAADHARCPHYQMISARADRDSCEARVRRCPPGAHCPIVDKIKRRRGA